MLDYTVALNADKSFASIGISPLQIFTLSVVYVCGRNQADVEGERHKNIFSVKFSQSVYVCVNE